MTRFIDQLPKIFKEFSQINFCDFYIVGGTTRNYFLKEEIGNDFDIEAHPTSLIHITEIVAELKNFAKQYELKFQELRYHVIRLSSSSYELEISFARREIFIEGELGHSNFSIELLDSKDLYQSLLRRDFRMNSILFDIINERFIDPYGGVYDCENKILSSQNPYFFKDPVRLLRAIRFKVKYDLRIEKFLSYELSKIKFDKLSFYYLNLEASKSLETKLFFTELLKFIDEDDFLYKFVFHFSKCTYNKIEQYRLCLNDSKYIQFIGIGNKNLKKINQYIEGEISLNDLPEKLARSLGVD